VRAPLARPSNRCASDYCDELASLQKIELHPITTSR
jgi:hypothetical protein